MELRRATDALLRAQVSPLAGLLSASSTTQRWHSSQQLRQTKPSCRTFANSTAKSAFRPSTTTSAKPTPAGRPKPSASADDLSNITKSLGWGEPSSTGAPNNRMNPGGSSSDDLLQAWHKSNPPKLSSAHQRASEFNFGNMLNPYDTSKSLRESGSNGSITDSLAPPSPPRVPLKLGPAAGRMVYVNENMTLTKSIRAVDMMCAKNRVRRDFMDQRYYERPGLKRKRLASVRWRRNFKASFTATVARVAELKRQGW